MTHKLDPTGKKHRFDFDGMVYEVSDDTLQEALHHWTDLEGEKREPDPEMFGERVQNLAQQLGLALVMFVGKAEKRDRPVDFGAYYVNAGERSISQLEATAMADLRKEFDEAVADLRQRFADYADPIRAAMDKLK